MRAEKFLSTPSARRATGDCCTCRRWNAISIHALREEGDEKRLTVNGSAGIFLSTPSARRATTSLPSRFKMVVISIHALREEGDASARSNAFMPSNFYPRPPRGGRPAAIAGRCRAADFYPRPPRGGRRAVGGVIVRRSRISIHALREEGDVLAV